MLGSLSGCGCPKLIDKLPCGSASISRTFLPSRAKPMPKLTQVVVLPTPPFWLVMAITFAFNFVPPFEFRDKKIDNVPACTNRNSPLQNAKGNFCYLNDFKMNESFFNCCYLNRSGVFSGTFQSFDCIRCIEHRKP